MVESALNAALREFEAVEANLIKMQKVLDDALACIPGGIAFGSNPEYDRHTWAFNELLLVLPDIDGWKPCIGLMELDEIAQRRFDAEELGEIELHVSLSQDLEEPQRALREYRYRFDKMRRELVREAVVELIDAVDANVRNLTPLLEQPYEPGDAVDSPEFDELRERTNQIEMLLGSSVPRPPRWRDLNRHAHFGQFGDLRDILLNDWPSARTGLRESMYGDSEPVPVSVSDLSALVSAKPRGPITTKLLWGKLDEEDFERLVFTLISSEPGYENPEWLTNTNAPDRGRDMSVTRVHVDPLSGTTRRRVIIQCKHWLTKSVSPADIALLKEQMKLWEPPRVDACVIATTGRFTTDAVDLIETHNQSDTSLAIEMWPESHLELLLASRPAVIAEFGLR